MRAAELYGDNSLPLASKEEDDEDDPFGIGEAWIALMVWLHSKGEFAPGMITEKEVQEFIRKHTEVLNEAVDYGIKQISLDDISKQRLRESNYVFSGIKTFHELNEALPSLLTEKGEIKPFNQFLNDVQTINKNYNSYYLRSEYNFAKASAEMAAKWKSFMTLNADRYNLQYRTAADEHVRRSHRLLHNVTLPITSKFWDYYFPPNGWNCRCNVVPVKKSDYPLSDEKKAMQDGSQATYGKHQEMFKFNPGKAMTTFPAYNAYTISKCQKCKDNGYLKLAADVPDNELCQACRIYRTMLEAKEKIKAQRKEIKVWAKENLIGEHVRADGISHEIGFNMKDITEALNQPHKHILEKNEAVRNIISLLKNGKYVTSRSDDKNNPMVKQYHYIRIKIENEDSYVVIRELVNGDCNLYSLVDKLKRRKDD